MIRPGAGLVAAGALLLALAVPAAAQRDETVDRAEIHALLMAYGSTLDAHDFDGFGALFARDGVYAAGTGAQAHGGAEAAAMMRRIFETSPLGIAGPKYRVFFNELVDFDGPDRAHASAMSFYMVPGEDGRPVIAMMARYTDELVREDGRWRFARRRVTGLMPAPSQSR